MSNVYVEPKPSPMSAINIVPLIGVFAALLVVVMMMLPSKTTQYTKDIGWTCWLGQGHDAHEIAIHITGTGEATIDGIHLSRREIAEKIAAGLKHDKHRLYVKVDVDLNASYEDAISMVSLLNTAGLNNDDIALIGYEE
jgi:biopolymer transport protein ExbD